MAAATRGQACLLFQLCTRGAALITSARVYAQCAEDQGLPALPAEALVDEVLDSAHKLAARARAGDAAAAANLTGTDSVDLLAAVTVCAWAGS